MTIWKRLTRASAEDAEVLSQLDPLINELWGYLRYLADLKAVWPRLTGDQRSEIDHSSAHQDRYHEKHAARLVEEIRSRTLEIRAHRHEPIKNQILAFLDDWQNQEPDMLKVITAMISRGDRKN